MPVIDIKGVGKAQFPDEMPIEDIKTFLRNKNFQDIQQGRSRALDPQPQTATNVNPSLIEAAGQKVSDYLFDQGIISDRYRAQEVGKSITGLGEFLPVLGDATAGDDFGKAAAQGDKLGMGVGLLGAVPVLGDVAKKVVKSTNNSVDNKKTERLFHASPVEFDEFDPARRGDRLTSLGLGHYLTPSKDKASMYGDNIMEFDVDTTDIFDWKNPTLEQREQIEKSLLKIIPEERISHFGDNKVEVLPRSKQGVKRFNELKEQTKNAYNDYAKARILTDDEIEKALPDFDFKNNDSVVVGWRESGNLKGANNEQLMILMNEYEPHLIASLGYKGARFGDEVAIYDPKLAKKVIKNTSNSADN